MFGRIWYNRNGWYVECPPHVMMRLRRLFKQMDLKKGRQLWISDTPENCRELEWFLIRYPMEVVEAELLAKRAQEHRDREEYIRVLLDGYSAPRPFELAIPPREYQKVAADIALKTGGLLVADDVGLGKTVTAIAMLSEPSTLPALVVTLTHLPFQWEAEINRFAPHLKTRVVKKGQPYDLTKFRRKDIGQPDVIIMNYHKLYGWAGELAGKVKTVIFDECQELRRGRQSNKGEGAHIIASHADYRIGLSVGPDSIVELRGGPFGAGWVGRIEDAWDVAKAGTRSEIAQDGYLPVYDVKGRGWLGDSFGWKPVRGIIKHQFGEQLCHVKLGGTSVDVTDDHSIFVADDSGLHEIRARDLRNGDIVPVDDGNGWNVGAGVDTSERPLVLTDVLSHVDRLQVCVDLSGVDRYDIGLSVWQWQNCHREATYGPRLPVAMYIKNRHLLPKPSLVYVGRGNAAALPALLFLSEWAYVLGFFIGDGWVSDGTRVCFAVENSRVDDFVMRLDALGIGLRPIVRRMKGRSVEVRCNHKLFAQVLDRVFGGAKCHEKRIPGEWITTWSDSSRRELINGLVDSDGHISKRTRNRTRVYFTTTSHALVGGLMSCLRSIGVKAGVHRRVAKMGGIVDGRKICGTRPSYQVHWSFAQMCGNSTGRYGRRKRYGGNFSEAVVSSLSVGQMVSFVYDLEMDGHPSFVVNGLLVHNSATPFYNYGGEMFPVMDSISPGSLGTRSEFVREWCIEMRDDRQSIKDPKAFGSWLRDQGLMLRRTREDVGRELPSLTKVPHYVDCDQKALDNVKGRATELAKLILDANPQARGVKFKAAEEISYLLRQATGISKAPYVAAFVRMLVETGERVLLYGWHRDVYGVWNDMLGDLEPRMYTGSESPRQKHEAARAFANGETQLLIMSLRSGAGVEGLQGKCRTVVFGELDWSPGVHEQAIGRIHRDGQEDKVIAYFLLTDSGSDPVIADTLGLKQRQIEGVRDPSLDLIERLDVQEDNVRRLAKAYLEQR